MTRLRLVPKIVACLLWLPVLLASAPAVSAQEATAPASDSSATTRPNFLVIVTDDQRWDQFGAMTPVIHTPEMDRLYKTGTRFANSFVTTSICAAGRASIFTGLVERTHGYTFGTPPLRPELVAMSYPAQLKAAGYRTGFVGKFGVGVRRGATDEMFDVFKPLRPSPYLKPQPDGSTRHLTDITGDQAIGFLKTCSAEQPFCLSVSFNAPHAEDGDKRQYIPPKDTEKLYQDFTVPPPVLGSEEFFNKQPEFLRESLNRVRWYWRFDTPEKYQTMVKNYWRMISGVDAVIGRLRETLAEQGLAENTVIIWTGDNGYFLGERGFAGKWLPYDRSLRVPLVIYDPRQAKAQPEGQTREEIALNIDLAPTVLGMAGLKPPAPMQGRSLQTLVAGQAAPSDWRTDFWCEHLMKHPKIIKHEGVRDARYRYSRYFEQQPVYEELFDLEADPNETVNLVGKAEHADRLEMMRRRCDELKQQYEQAAAAAE